MQRNKDFPEGIKYSLVYVKKKNDEYERILGYDNEKGKVHHEHMFGEERAVEFTGMVKMIRRFQSEVENLRRELYGNEG